MMDESGKPVYPHANLTHEIIGAAMEVHSTLGFGFLESVYEEAMAIELGLRGIEYERQKLIDIFYKGIKTRQFVCDFLVNENVLVELKALRQLTAVEEAQVLNYLKATGVKVGLLINFGSSSLKYKRLVYRIAQSIEQLILNKNIICENL